MMQNNYMLIRAERSVYMFVIVYNEVRNLSLRILRSLKLPEKIFHISSSYYHKSIKIYHYT